MTRRSWIAAAAVLLGTVVYVTGSALPAWASCAPRLTVSDAITQSDLVVVGTVTSTRSRNRIATVAVDEVWKGDVGSTVEVVGGPQSDNSGSSVDRTYEVGVRYLIVAYEPEAHGYPNVFGGRYEDNNCSVTQPWTDTLAVFRPSSARVSVPPPVSSPTAPTGDKQSDNSITVWLVVGGVTLLAASSGVWWFRRRRQVPLEQT